MTESRVEVVIVGAIAPHPNADTLGITKVYDYPVIVKLGDFVEGQRAVYVPVDSVVPESDPRWAFLGEHRRIRAKRLRGTFSMGLLTAADPAWPVGAEVSAALGIVKYEPPEPSTMGGENERDPGTMPVYDVEGLRRWPGLFVDGEEVWVTEKIHGANGRFVHDGARLWVGSRTSVKREDERSLWWRVATKHRLAERLATVPHVAIYGEVYGQVQDLKYGVDQKEQSRLAVFDAVDTRSRRWFDVDDLVDLAGRLDLPMVPTLYRGPWGPSVLDLAEGLTTTGAGHVREGIVVKPVRDRTHPELGRVVLKLHGQGYLLRKGG